MSALNNAVKHLDGKFISVKAEGTSYIALCDGVAGKGQSALQAMLNAYGEWKRLKNSKVS